MGSSASFSGDIFPFGRYQRFMAKIMAIGCDREYFLGLKVPLAIAIIVSGRADYRIANWRNKTYPYTVLAGIAPFPPCSSAFAWL
jgi:hypothetical protein